MRSVHLADAFAVSLFSLLVLLIRRATRPKRLPYPRGPPGLPIVGNVLDLPQENEGPTHAAFAKRYGPVVHFRLLTRHIIVVNDAKSVADLFDARGSIYSDRPQFPMLSDVMGWAWSTALMPYGPVWRAHRRLLQHFYQSTVPPEHLDTQRTNSLILLQWFQREPAGFFDHAHRYGAASILKTSYGIDTAEHDDPYVELGDKAANSVIVAGMPGTYLVDWIPAVKHVPSWFPGAQFKRNAKVWRKMADDMLHIPYEHAKRLIEEGSATPSMVSEYMGHAEHTSEVVQNCAAMTYIAGIDTTVSIINGLILAMVQHPEIQAIAQAEIDRVVGSDRLPDIHDRELLPYTHACILEAYRRYPPVPLGIPRRIMEDDVYNGHHMPRGAIILGNIWAVNHDESVYKDPLQFQPARFLRDGKLDPTVKDPKTAVFGFGRRICPGRFFADSAIWFAASRLLACFEFKPIVKNGVPVPPEGKMRSGLGSGPVPFECDIRPRRDLSVYLSAL